MKKLLSLPPNLVDSFHDVTGLSREEYFCTNDPVGHKLGSGGGTTWLLQACMTTEDGASLAEWLPREKRILLHAGGQSRRLPSYAPSGKILTPVPVFRWERGQRLSQDLLSLQLPLYEQMMDMAPEGIHTMVVSGDVLVRTSQPLQPIPDADVVCYGLWLDASVAKNHGVFVSSRKSPQVLKHMLQKPSIETLNELQKDHYYLTDIGIWMLSDKAVELLAKKSKKGDDIIEYDMYSEFGCALGTNPSKPDEDLLDLKVAIVPLQGGEFYHFGTSREMISSTLRIQNLVNDQREIMHHDRKPHPSIFVQNAVCKYKFTEDNTNIWIENSDVSEGWTLSHDNIITGVPQNHWKVNLAPGECIDVVPIGDTEYAVRLYHIDDKFAGAEQQKQQFPVVADLEAMSMLQTLDGLALVTSRMISAEEISTEANLHRLFDQRKAFRKLNWRALAKNWNHSVFYQLDLADAKREFDEQHIGMPPALDADAPLMTRIHDAMFRGESDKAFTLLREGISPSSLILPPSSKLSVAEDQIVWGRSPVRIDIAGGWTDTPPYCLMEGGNVINLAIELNGQPPLQTYVRPCQEPRIVLRSIDLGAMEVVETSEQLRDFMHVGSPFSIPKAALVLAGFGQHSLNDELAAFGAGIELTLLSAIPAGSGLGTSSILAATVLGALNDFCGLGWDKNEIGHRTLMLEQMLTTGGGWQDQFGGVLGGVKLLQTGRGFAQNPQVRWLPTDLWTQPEYRPCHLLYYTGITRTAKSILAEIVRGMFLNCGDELRLLRQMKQHTLDMYEAIQQNDFERMGLLVRKTWRQNQTLDAGTNPADVAKLTSLIDDLCLGYKLPGAGGGGYLYMIAKDPEAAARIKQILSENSIRKNARFVDMSLSTTGLQISRS
ncbi:bifunctional fucokinase/fucose-1-phosphate guanylyltransferase [Xylanibacter ruminicola]|uniref:bifunctional fucokinase/fucose-1-phosphate guanylyltransferase n=1 Tax=Xylanibacter ruminicola TaxID=839 RepID=UPI0009BF3D58|nr:bifunctional fucokinase/fucose-1-phosphate guanylyltransferase [Xylanibacter ruminicola]